jgi:hypothetical protein
LVVGIFFKPFQSMGPFDRVNEIIEAWGKRKLKEAQSSGRGMGIRHSADSPNTGESLANMKVSFKRKLGDQISAITFKLRRTLFYVYHGAGRGYGGSKGSTWYTSDGERRKTNPASIGKADTGGRQAKPFLDVIEEDVPNLLDDVAEATMDAIFENSFKHFK